MNGFRRFYSRMFSDELMANNPTNYPKITRLEFEEQCMIVSTPKWAGRSESHPFVPPPCAQWHKDPIFSPPLHQKLWLEPRPIFPSSFLVWGN